MAHSFHLLLFGCALNLFYVTSSIANPIINGTPDTKQDFKHQVSIHSLGSRANTFQYICGGTIVSERHILTAASCFMNKVNREIRKLHSLRGGSTKIIAGSNSINGPGVEKDIIQVIIPEQYNEEARIHGDIAVAWLSSELGIPYNSHRMHSLQVGEPFPHDYEANQKALFSGFGFHQLQKAPNGVMHPVHGFSPINQFLNVRMLPSSECPYYKYEICAKSSDDELPIRVSCTGDSGAGLVFEQSVIGVLSSGPPDCNTNQQPMIFTRISFFKYFIDEAMKEHGSRLYMHVLEEDNDIFIPTPRLSKQKSVESAESSSSKSKRNG